MRQKKILIIIMLCFLPPVYGVPVDVSVHGGVEAHRQHDDIEGVQQPDVDHLQYSTGSISELGT